MPEPANTAGTAANRFRPFIVFGTRPEAIKLPPVILKYLSQLGRFSPLVCSTGQHPEMLDQGLGYFFQSRSISTWNGCVGGNP